MSNITTTSNLTPPVLQSFEYKLLSVKVPNMIHNIAAMRSRMPANGGTTLRYQRFNKLDPSLVPLGNSGIEGPPQALSALSIDAVMQFYGKICAVVKSVLIDLETVVAFS